MISSKWNRYIRVIACAFLLYILFRYLFNHVPDDQSNFTEYSPRDPRHLQPFDASDELHQYSSVFFIESSAPFKALVTIEPRQACAIESAARANPRKKIIVLFASWHDVSKQLRFPDLPLLALFPNVHFRRLDLENFAKGTPVEDVIDFDRLKGRLNGAEYLSEILRLVLLYRFGGIYLDLDVVTLKTLDFYNPNFFGAESEQLAGSSVMGLERRGFGQIFAERCLNNFKNFDKQNNVHNGSFLITYGVVQACEKLTLKEVVETGCGGLLEVYSQRFFNPFDETNVAVMFDTRQLEKAKQMMEGAMTVHVLHSTSRKFRTRTKGKTGYRMVAESYCPTVYNDNRDEF